MGLVSHIRELCFVFRFFAWGEFQAYNAAVNKPVNLAARGYRSGLEYLSELFRFIVRGLRECRRTRRAKDS